jgi:cytoskeletal protein CcmA (bactofilin family)
MVYRKILKAVGSVFLVFLFVFTFISPVQAFEFKGGENITIQSGEVIDDDMYVGANEFVLDGTIKGDLIVFGSLVTIGQSGVVEGDLIAMGQSVVINGAVEDDARLAGASLSLGEEASVGDDLVAAGYSLETHTGSKVGGSLLFFGGQAVLGGKVADDVTVNAMGLELNGEIGGNIEAELGGQEDMPPFTPFAFMPNMPAIPSVSGGLSIGPDAQIGGDLSYIAPEDADIPAGTVTGGIDREEPLQPEIEDEPPPSTAERTWSWLLGFIRRLVTLLLVGLLLVWLVPRFVQRGALKLYEKPLPSLGWGIVAFFAVFFVILTILVVTIVAAMFFGLITLGGLATTIVLIGFVLMGCVFLVFYVSAAYLSKILISFLIGRLILGRLNDNWSEGRFWPLVVGVLLFVILTAIPYLGWLINLLVILLGLGALWLLAREYLFTDSQVPENKVV